MIEFDEVAFDLVDEVIGTDGPDDSSGEFRKIFHVQIVLNCGTIPQIVILFWRMDFRVAVPALVMV